MAKTIHLDYCGIAASGATVREAKQDAARKLTSLVSDLTRHSPEIVTCGAYSALVYRDAYGWQSRLITDENGTVRSGPIYAAGGETGRKDAIMSACAHVAQLAWSHEVENDRAFAETAGLDQRKVADLVSWAAWQRRYRIAADAGCSDHEARAVADGMRSMPVQAAA